MEHLSKADCWWKAVWGFVPELHVLVGALPGPRVACIVAFRDPSSCGVVKRPTDKSPGMEKRMIGTMKVRSQANVAQDVSATAQSLACVLTSSPRHNRHICTAFDLHVDADVLQGHVGV